MKLKDIIAIADKAYPEGLLKCARDGDKLAQFIKVELRETYDSKQPSLEQVDSSLTSMELAQRELVTVVNALAKTRAEMIFGKK